VVSQPGQHSSVSEVSELRSEIAALRTLLEQQSEVRRTV
jgi:hypothetical protein